MSILLSTIRNDEILEKSTNNTQIVKRAKEQQNNEAIPRTALARLPVKKNFENWIEIDQSRGLLPQY